MLLRKMKCIVVVLGLKKTGSCRQGPRAELRGVVGEAAVIRGPWMGVVSVLVIQVGDPRIGGRSSTFRPYLLLPLDSATQPSMLLSACCCSLHVAGCLLLTAVWCVVKVSRGGGGPRMKVRDWRARACVWLSWVTLWWISEGEKRLS